MKKILKILNPFIGAWNFFCYMAHCEGQKLMDEYEPYDFSKDVKYF